jgi:hypothetical protein
MIGLRAVRNMALLAIGVLMMSPEGAAAQKKQRDLIKNEEFVANVTNDVSATVAIRRLRPHFFESKGVRSLGNSTMNPLRLFVDRSEQPLETLANYLAWDLEEAGYLPPSEAGMRYGDRANGGAIVIKLAVKVKVKKDSTPR